MLMLRLVFIASILFSAADNYAQTDPSAFLKRFFIAVKNSDSAAFLSCFISAAETDVLINNLLTDSGYNVTAHSGPGISSKIYTDQLLHIFFKKLQLQADSLHINWRTASYSDCKYQLIKDPEIIYPSLKGEIICKDGNKKFTLPIKEAIIINDSLKISEMGDLAIVLDAAVLKKSPRKLTAFDSFKIEIKDVRLEEVKAEPEPPPPPPPPPGKKVKRKN